MALLSQGGIFSSLCCQESELGMQTPDAHGFAGIHSSAQGGCQQSIIVANPLGLRCFRNTVLPAVFVFCQELSYEMKPIFLPCSKPTEPMQTPVPGVSTLSLPLTRALVLPPHWTSSSVTDLPPMAPPL